MNRMQAISTIESLYGTEGDIAWKVIKAVVAEMGVDAFRDDALRLIAETQQREHDKNYGN